MSNFSNKIEEGRKGVNSRSFLKIKKRKIHGKGKQKHSTDYIEVPKNLKKALNKLKISHKLNVKPTRELPHPSVDIDMGSGLIPSKKFSNYILQLPSDIIRDGDTLLSLCSNKVTGIQSISLSKKKHGDKPHGIVGDVNGDGMVNCLDVVSSIEHIITRKKLQGNNFKIADMNGDGVIDVRDVSELINYILEKKGKINHRQNVVLKNILDIIDDNIERNPSNRISGYTHNTLMVNILKILMGFIEKDPIYSIYWRNKDKKLSGNIKEVDETIMKNYHDISIQVYGYVSDNYFTKGYCTEKSVPSFAIFRKLGRNKFIFKSLNFNNKKFKNRTVTLLKYNKIDDFKKSDLFSGKNQVITL